MQTKMNEIDFSKPIDYNQPILMTYFQKEPIIFTKFGPYHGPVTLQYLPYGGIQSVFHGHLIIHIVNGFMSVDELIYQGIIYQSDEFITRYPDLVNQVLPN